MELQQLRYFQVVATTEHITQSAEILNVSQPAISTMISRLEKEVGTKLFDRTGRNIRLNEHGKIFLSYITKALLELENAENHLKELRKERQGMISLTVTSPQFLQGINEFLISNPDTRWRQSVDSLSSIKAMLQNGHVDLAITSPGFADPRIESTVLLDDEFVVALHPDHKLAKAGQVAIKDLENARFIALHKEMPFRHQTDELLESLGIAPNIIMECDHYLRRELLNANMGLTIASKSAQFRHLYDKDVKFLPIKGVKAKRQIVLSRLKNKFQTEEVTKFIEFLANYYDQIANLDINL